MKLSKFVILVMILIQNDSYADDKKNQLAKNKKDTVVWQRFILIEMKFNKVSNET